MVRPLPIPHALRLLAVSLGALGLMPGCRDCTKGYVLQDDGTCFAEEVVGQDTLDSGQADAGPGEPTQAVLAGEVRPGTMAVDAETSLVVELWASEGYDLYGPDRERRTPFDEAPLSAETLLTDGAVPFSATVRGISARGQDVFVWVEVETAAGPVFVEAANNPYVLLRDQTLSTVVVTLDTPDDR